MKNLCVIPFLLATLLAVSTAVAQMADGPATDTLSEPSGISAARSKYLEKAADTADPKDSQTVAQLPRRGPRMPRRPQRGYYGGGYPAPWMANGDPGHVLIGAGIGFAIGAAIGAVAAAENGKSVGNAVCLGGPLFALFGAAIGASHGSSHPFIHRRRTYPVWPEEDEEGSLRSPQFRSHAPCCRLQGREPCQTSHRRPKQRLRCLQNGRPSQRSLSYPRYLLRRRSNGKISRGSSNHGEPVWAGDLRQCLGPKHYVVTRRSNLFWGNVFNRKKPK